MFLFTFDSYNLLFSLLMSFSIQVLFFAIAVSFKTDKVTDLSYGLTFIIIAYLNMFINRTFNPLQLILVLMITLWGLRLAAYLFIRILKTGRDKRFDKIRNRFFKFAQFWFLQAVSVWIIMFPSILFLNPDIELTASLFNIIGGLIWSAGLIIETLADWQKFVFKSNPENKRKWIQSGLWKYSRHPNYFGELLCWWGVFIYVLPYLNGLMYISIIGPLFISFLILKVSGIPILEKKYDQRYKNNKEYKKYKKTTSVLVLMPKKNI